MGNKIEIALFCHGCGNELEIEHLSEAGTCSIVPCVHCNDTLEGFCPGCESQTALGRVDADEGFDIGDEHIVIRVSYLVCQDGHVFDNPKSDDDSLDMAYREYERRTGKVWRGTIGDGAFGTRGVKREGK